MGDREAEGMDEERNVYSIRRNRKMNVSLFQVVAFSAVLRTRGVGKGDTVSIYLPMVR